MDSATSGIAKVAADVAEAVDGRELVGVGAVAAVAAVDGLDPVGFNKTGEMDNFLSIILHLLRIRKPMLCTSFSSWACWFLAVFLLLPLALLLAADAADAIPARPPPAGFFVVLFLFFF
jgi:hypothetical protein